MILTGTSHRDPSSPFRGRALRLAAILFGLALIPRLILALALLRTPIGLDDMHQYDMLARSLAAGHGYRWYGRQDVELLRPLLEREYQIDLPKNIPELGYRTAYRPPGYPIMLAAIYRLAGFTDRLPAARLAQAFLGSLAASMTGLLALRLGLSFRGALLAGAVVALYPYYSILPAGLASENLFIPLTLLTLLLLLAHSRRKTSWALIAAAALAMAASTLTRVVMLAFVPFAAWWIYRTAARPVRTTLAFSAIYLAVVSPWAIHNSEVLQRPSFVDGSLGYNLFVGYHPDGDGGFSVEQAIIPLQFLDDATRDRWAMDQALRFIQRDPLEIPIRIAQRWVYFWSFEDRELIYFYANGYFGALPSVVLVLAYLVLVSPFPIVLISSIVGFLSLKPERSWLLSFIAALSVPYLLVLATSRFHLPLIPLLSVYASAAWTGHMPAVRPGKLTIALAALFTAAVILAWAIDLSVSWPTLQQVVAPGGHRLGLDY